MNVQAFGRKVLQTDPREVAGVAGSRADAARPVTSPDADVPRWFRAAVTAVVYGSVVALIVYIATTAR